VVALLAGKPLSGEVERNRIACNDYLRMGAGRSLAKLRQMYVEYTSEKPPTVHLRTLQRWSSVYDWQARAAAYDAEIEQQKTAYVEQRRREALESGLALDFERVLTLKHLADTLGREIWERSGEFIKDAIWLPDVKSIGSGEFAERIDIVRFNRAILEEFRSVLDDLAKETGGRRQKSDVDIKSGGKPIDTAFADALKAVYGSDDDTGTE
jgi:hypothetical protein